MAASSALPRTLPSSHLQANGLAMSTQYSKTPAGSMSQTAQRADRYRIAEVYEVKLSRKKNGALFVAGLQKTSRFFGICALTWATVVLLGGFASSLRRLDFFLISILLLLEAARLSTTQVFRKLLSKTLFRERHHPEDFQHEDLQYYWASRLDLVGQISSCLVAIVGLAFVTVRLAIAGRYPLIGRDELRHSNSNLPPSLYTFYVLVILISIPATLSGFCRPFLRWSTEDSLMCYHDEVYKTAMEEGMPEADDLEPLEFAFSKLARDHMRNIRPLTIKKRNENLIDYIYHSQNGVEITCEYLKSSDVWKQQVAANLPGFWEGKSRIEKQVALFWALRDRLSGAGKVAEGAANSVQCLARSWADKTFELHPFLINDPSKLNSANVVDTLVDLVVHPMRPTLAFQIRALESCCRHPQVLKHICSEGNNNPQSEILRQKLQAIIVGNHPAAAIEKEELSRPEKLCRTLRSVVMKSSSRERTKIYATNALKSLVCIRGGELSTDAKQVLAEMVGSIDPARLIDGAFDKKGQPKRAEPYVLEDERSLLDNLRQYLGLPEYSDWHVFL